MGDWTTGQYWAVLISCISIFQVGIHGEPFFKNFNNHIRVITDDGIGGLENKYMFKWFYIVSKECFDLDLLG